MEESIRELLNKHVTFTALNDREVATKAISELVERAALEARNEIRAQTYDFLHSRDRELCEEWESQLQELEK